MKLTSHRVWLAITACLLCLLCLHVLLQVQEQQRYVPPTADIKLPVEPSKHHHVTQQQNQVLHQMQTQGLHGLTHGLPYTSILRPANINDTLCPGLVPPNEPYDSQTFQPIRQGRSWVFSAAYDPRPSSHVVRVIGIADLRKDSKPHWCRMWFHDDTQPDIRPVIEDIVPETHDKRFAAFIYTCPLRNRIPYAVSLVRDKCETAANLLQVLEQNIKTRHKSNFTVCVSPFNFAFNNYKQMIEMVETNQIFGADHFVFYNYSIGADLEPYLSVYESVGLADVIQWQLPIMLDPHSPKDPAAGIHYYGQLASLNDCLYRNIARAKYIVFLDLDEVIVPKSFSNWSTVISSLPKKLQQQICSVVFKNTFFRTEWTQPRVYSDKEQKLVHDLGLTFLKTTLREDNVFPMGSRSKFIADTRRLEMAGIHLPWKCLKERYNYDVPQEVAKLHHYRSWKNPTIHNAVQDKTLLRYANDVIQRVSLRYQSLQGLIV